MILTKINSLKIYCKDSANFLNSAMNATKSAEKSPINSAKKKAAPFCKMLLSIVDNISALRALPDLNNCLCYRIGSFNGFGISLEISLRRDQRNQFGG